MRRPGMSRAVTLLLCALASVGVSHTRARAAEPAPVQGKTVWTPVETHGEKVKSAAAWIRPERGQALVMNVAAMREVLERAPLEGTPAAAKPMTLLLPDPDGLYQEFQVLNAPVMEPGLAAQFPEIITLVGQGVEDPTATLRADITMHGFHAQVLSAFGDWYIDPYSKGDDAHYTSYYKRHLKRTSTWSCEVHAAPGVLPTRADRGTGDGPQLLSSGTQLRTYRTAVACTGEYAAFHGGTVAAAQSAIVTAINRVTGVYERDVAIRLTLVANNTNVVFTNASTDPYTNSSGGTMLGQNQTRLDTAPPTGIGSANYDIGHVFSTGGGGVAGLGVVCVSGNKARGVTGQPSPTGDPFYIDYVAHEMGHQFGANHCFNSTTSSCGGGNRNGTTAYEIGSGSTIMSYAGICGADNLQANSDAYFHNISFSEIRTFVVSGNGSSCGTQTATGNTVPTVSGPGNFTIPRGTPFFLTATASDANGDALTYCWEELALGVAQTVVAADNGTSPLTRSRAPSVSPTRFIPTLANVLAGTSNAQEELPSVNRTSWAWRCTIRDNRAGGGGVNEANAVLTVTTLAGPFNVTAPSGSVAWPGGSTQTVNWNVASTNAAPVNAANVVIEFSTDNGNTWGATLLASTPNDGTETLTVPNTPTSLGRVRVRALGNIFYNVSLGNITVTPSAPTVVLNGTGVNTINDVGGDGNANGRIDPGEDGVTLSVQINNTGTTTATGVSATLTTTTPTVAIVSGASAYADLTSGGGTGVPTAPFVLDISPAHGCGAPINLTLSITSTQGTGSYVFSLPTGLNTGTGFVCDPPDPVCPQFTQQPTSLTSYCLGAAASFTVAATGDPAPTYQWFKGVNALSDGPDYNGTGTSTLSIPSALAFTGGVYTCVVTNACTSITSDPATLSFCLADFNCVGGVSVQDIFDFMAAYFAGNPRADVNGASGISVQDIFDFLAAYFVGCV